MWVLRVLLHEEDYEMYVTDIYYKYKWDGFESTFGSFKLVWDGLCCGMWDSLRRNESNKKSTRNKGVKQKSSDIEGTERQTWEELQVVLQGDESDLGVVLGPDQRTSKVYRASFVDNGRRTNNCPWLKK